MNIGNPTQPNGMPFVAFCYQDGHPVGAVLEKFPDPCRQRAITWICRRPENRRVVVLNTGEVIEFSLEPAIIQFWRLPYIKASDDTWLASKVREAAELSNHNREDECEVVLQEIAETVEVSRDQLQPWLEQQYPSPLDPLPIIVPFPDSPNHAVSC